MKLVKLSLGIALTAGLTACNMWDMQRPEEPNVRYVPMESTQPKVVKGQAQVQTQAVKSKVAQKSYAPKDAVQKSTPGPVRRAAPQLPVIE